MHQRLIEIAQCARARVSRGAANHLAAETTHDERAEFAIDRGTDQDAQFHAGIALIEQIFGAKQLVLMPVHGNERRRARERRS